MDVKIDVSGNMEPPQSTKTSQFDLSNLTTSITSKFPGNIGEFVGQVRQNFRPITEFLNTQNFKTVGSIQRLTSRITRNAVYFQSNYICLVLVLMLYCLITSPLILVVLCGIMYACYKIRQSQTALTVFGRRLNTYQQCLLVYFAAAPVLYLAGAGQAFLWVLGASMFVISLHAGFYNIDAIVTEDTEGFLAETV